jgi:hypothetical protein
MKVFLRFTRDASVYEVGQAVSGGSTTEPVQVSIEVINLPPVRLDDGHHILFGTFEFRHGTYHVHGSDQRSDHIVK